MAWRAVGYGDRELRVAAPVTPGVLCDGWLYVSGQVALDLDTSEVKRGTIEDETRTVLENMGRILQAAGCGFEDIVKVTVHLGEIADFAGMNSVYREFFSGTPPARTTVQSVLWNDLRVEIEAIARVPAG